MDFGPSVKGWDVVVEPECGVGNVFQAGGNSKQGLEGSPVNIGVLGHTGAW